VGLALGIGRQPGVGHPVAVDQLLQIKPPKRPRHGREGGVGLFGYTKHRLYVSRTGACRHWEKWSDRVLRRRPLARLANLAKRLQRVHLAGTFGPTTA